MSVQHQAAPRAAKILVRHAAPRPPRWVWALGTVAVVQALAIVTYLATH